MFCNDFRRHSCNIVFHNVESQVYCQEPRTLLRMLGEDYGRELYFKIVAKELYAICSANHSPSVFHSHYSALSPLYQHTLSSFS